MAYKNGAVMKFLLPCFMLLFVTSIVIAGEWNDKPVMCSKAEETFEAIKDKGEVLLFIGQEYSKVRNERGLSMIPAKIPLSFYANLESGTYSIVEYHPTYKSYCVIAYGVNLHDFRGGVD